MSVRIFLAVLFLHLSCVANAQGYAGLGTTADGFAVPDPNYTLSFPRDDGAHPEFRVEWWYLTANLKDDFGRDYGIQWTLFRTAGRPEAGEGWSSPQIWMGHAAATSSDLHHSNEIFSRGAIGQAGAQAQPFEAWIDDWTLRADPDHPGDMIVNAGGDRFSFRLNLSGNTGRVLHGANGFSVKSPLGQSSHYYSLPFLDARGTLELEGESFQVSGDAWLDREWSSQPLSSDQTGWDWVGLKFDDGRRLMAARVRGNGPDFHFGTLINKEGDVIELSNEELTIRPMSEGIPPTRLSIEVPKLQIAVAVKALNPSAFTGNLFPYWEGPVQVSGSHSGRGYLEMTGY